MKVNEHIDFGEMERMYRVRQWPLNATTCETVAEDAALHDSYNWWVINDEIREGKKTKRHWWGHNQRCQLTASWQQA